MDYLITRTKTDSSQFRNNPSSAPEWTDLPDTALPQPLQQTLYLTGDHHLPHCDNLHKYRFRQTAICSCNYRTMSLLRGEETVIKHPFVYYVVVNLHLLCTCYFVQCKAFVLLFFVLWGLLSVRSFFPPFFPLFPVCYCPFIYWAIEFYQLS